MSEPKSSTMSYTLLRGGAAARYKKMQRYLRQRTAGEVKRLLQEWSDLPGRADSKVALHFIDRRVRPSSKEGMEAFATPVQFTHTFINRRYSEFVRWILLLVIFALAPTAVLAQQDKVQPEPAPKHTEQAQPQTGEDGKLISVPGGKALGMSILGNQEAPKALVIVPWKRSELGNTLGISTMLDDSKLPVDKEVFMRMLSYYEIRSGTARPESAPAKTTSAQPTAATSRRKQ
jgi:hypothetical protein